MEDLNTASINALTKPTVYRQRPVRPSFGSRSGAWTVLALLLTFMASSCNALKDINKYSVEEDKALGLQAYGQVLQEENTLSSGPEVQQAKRVTDRLIASANELHPDIAPDFDWEVTVIDNAQTINAFCLPGGKMAVYTGILSVAQTDAALAVVMGHEIAHAIERHGTERMTRQGITSSAIEVLLQDPTHQQWASIAAGLVERPWGQGHELEADQLGLMILANAGYDPNEGPKFWVKMGEVTGGGDESAIGQFFSTHPSPGKRVERLKEAIPAAMTLYEAKR